MDVEALHVALQQSFSPDTSQRLPAEELIKNLKYVEGSTPMLLRVTAEKQVQFEVRQAAAIQLKNICRDCWVKRVSALTGAPLFATDGEGNQQQAVVVLSQEDKVVVRDMLVEALLNEPEKSIRDLLAETLHTAVCHDYPENWPTLLPTLLETIRSSGGSGDGALRVHNSLLALRKIAKRYEYKAKEQRGPLNDLVAQSFPLLLPLAQRLISPDEHSLEAALMLKQILKIFWSSTQFYLPTVDLAQMQPWFDVLIAVLGKKLPEASTGLEPRNQPTSVEERNAWPWWKVKKWAVQNMSRLFSRYGMPAYAEQEVREFSKVFSVNVATRFLGPVCETLNLRPSGQFCTDRVVHLCLGYVDLAVELAATYKMLKPHMDFLLYKVCFPTICLTEEDIQLFENDPHEFIQRESSALADFYDPRKAAITLMMNLVRHRGKDVTQKLLMFLTECVKRYSAASDESQQNHVEKDGALLAFGSLSEFLLSKKKYSSQLEGLLVSSVFPDFNSPVGFLRYRACYMVQKFSKVSWSDDGTNLRTLIQLVLQRLSDSALPVQIEASKALRFLIELDGAKAALLPVLPQILTEYFRIMNQIGNDEVVAALQVIIDKFGDHIEPHAVALITQLSTAFSTYCEAGSEDDDAAMAAAQCLECIATVLKGICERPDLFRELEPKLIPLILRILGSDDYIEYLECALDILTFLTYFPDTISPQLWEAFPLIYNAYDQFAFDFLNMMVVPLDNFIAKAPQHFLSATTPKGVKYVDLVFSMVAKTVGEDRSNESECRKALSLLMSVLLNCKGQIDAYLPLINDITVVKLGQQVNAEVPLTRIVCFQVLGSALFYNPLLELQELEKRGVTQQVLSEWIKDTDKMDKWLSRKLTVLGMTAIMQIPTSAIPTSAVSSLPQIISTAVKITELMKEDSKVTNDEDEHDDALDDVDGEDEFDEGGFDENEDVTNEADQAYLKALNSLNGPGNDVARFLIGDDWDEDDDDDDYTSPIDEVDQLLFLSDTLRAAFHREPEVYQQVQSALPADIVGLCQKLFAAAEAQRSEDAQAR